MANVWLDKRYVIVYRLDEDYLEDKIEIQRDSRGLHFVGSHECLQCIDIRVGGLASATSLHFLSAK